MNSLFNADFIEWVATDRCLSKSERNMFKLKCVEDLNYAQIHELYLINPGRAQGHMRGVYEKFCIDGAGRGKTEKLRRRLLEMQIEWELKSQNSNQKVVSEYSSLFSPARLSDKIFSEIVSRLESVEHKVGQLTHPSFLQRMVPDVPWSLENTLLENLENIHEMLQKGDVSPHAVLRNIPLFAKELSSLANYSERDLALRLLDVLIDMLKMNSSISQSISTSISRSISTSNLSEVPNSSE